MMKSELIKRIADKLGVPQVEVGKNLAATLEALNEVLQEGRQVNLHGFGTLAVIHRGARAGRNPRTGEAITIPPCKTVRFTPARRLKALINPKAPC